MITVVGLGPADASLIAPAARAAIDAHERRFLRTRVHPAADAVIGAESFDAVYDAGASFAAVYEEIVERLVEAADEGDLVYAVPGSPLVLERTVKLLRAAADGGRIGLEIVPAMSFLDLVWARLRVDPVEAGVRLVDGHVFATAAAGQPGPLLVAHCHATHVLSEVKLALDPVADDGPTVTVLQRLGLPDESVREVAWADLDREVVPDHLTSLWIPRLAEPVAAEFARFDELVRTLRDQCPWDRAQTHASLRRHLLEEAHETLEAIDARAGLGDDEYDGERDDHLAEELGDLLYQVFFHARLASERGAFTVADVARGIHDKLVVRHPHVFGDVELDGDEDAADTVVANWEAIKKAEKGRDSAMDGVPASLPALLFALKVQQRAARTDVGVVAEPAALDRALVDREPGEDELGDLLFGLVAVARRLDIDPESALRAASARFVTRFREAEAGPPCGPG